MSNKEEKKPNQPQVQSESDFNERMEELKKELIPMLAKYEIDIAGRAIIMNDGRIGADLVFFSTRNLKKGADEKSSGAQVQPVEGGLENPEA